MNYHNLLVLISSERFLFFQRCPDQLGGTSVPIGNRGFPGLRQQECEDDHSIPPYVLMACMALVEPRDNF
jgi:hypothetical protein